jgi:vanillate O-demethylase ferredoxin subunit
MWRLAAGNSISISNPQNLFEFSFGRPHYLLLAGGIGITPLVGMAQCLMAIGASFQMLYCGRSFCEMAYLNELDQLLGSCLQLAIKDEGTRVDLHKVFQSLPADTEVYFCGPIHMLEAARSIWRDQNRPSERFRFETFGSSGQFPRESFNVHVHDLGRSVAVTENMTMLDALENAGIPIMSDCRRGECGLCLVDVVALEGQIDHRDVFLSDDQKQQGSKICTCVSRAVNGSITIDSGFRSSAAGISR